MYLKRLESVGFKSFAEPISVDFVPGVTAVVGPNGSGKSNVTDAIRWVLGEQSAKSLRGTKMEDIIFQGSDTRKPLNMAEVTLILDNSDRSLPIDYQEVNVTRRVYRSGESEYLLNKQSCRLKDIVDLFLDSGLGKEAFSIIGQGKIEEILSSKAEERRTIFEEAAGVLKYKKRKGKAEFKLAETQENLNRVEDIIYEIEGQLEPLKHQSSIAKEYLTLKDQLKDAEITLLRTEIENRHREWQSYLKEIGQIKEKENDFSANLQIKGAHVEKVENEIATIDHMVEEYQHKLLNLTESIEKLTGNRNVVLERAKYTRENKDKLTEKKKDLKAMIEKTNDVYQFEVEKLDKIKASSRKAIEELNHLKLNLDINQDELEQNIESLKADYIEQLNQQASTKHAIKMVETQIEALDNQKQTSQNEQSVVDNEYEVMELEKAELTKKYDQIHLAIERLMKQIKEKESERDQMQASIKDMREKLDQGNRQIDRLQSRKETLEEMKEDFQGFYAGVKTILKARDKGKLNGIHGAVIELIDIPDIYLVSLETALATQAQHVVVANERAGREAIDLLKSKNKGRATFLPLNVIKAKQIPNHYLSKLKAHQGFVAVANTVPKTEQAFQIVVDYLLGSTIIAKTLKDANQLASLVDRRYRIVTLDGDIVNPGGSMTGGARKASHQPIFTRDKELENLTEKINEFTVRRDAFEGEIKQRSMDLDQLKTACAYLIEQKDDKHSKLRKTKNDIQSCEIQLTHIKKQIDSKKQNEAQKLSTYNRLCAEKENYEAELIMIKTTLDETKGEIDKLTEKKKTFEENTVVLKSKVQALEIQVAEAKKEVAYQLEKVAQLKDKLSNLKEEVSDVDEELRQILIAEAQIEQIAELDEKIKTSEEEKHEVIEKIQAQRKKRLVLTESLAKEEDEHRLIQNRRQYLVDKRQQLEVKANRLDVELENHLMQLQEDYELSFEKAKEMYNLAIDLKELRRKVKLIKRTIEELGTVSLGSIEEYERILERYQFLTDQQTDLTEAKETLYAVIDEMDEEMQERFEETFSQIKVEFTEVFRQLFGGGHAELSLTNPEALLTTGVEIKAQPPGKKAQQLALLSGGERALTAIALLFAILKVRPVPFCVLDEVEAALDEANVDRFSQYLKTFSEETQFIVITHRKGTMEGADVLYGVTMQEAGVSRFVSVKLEEADELIETV